MRKMDARKNTNPYLLNEILKSLDADITHAQLPMPLTLTAKIEFLKQIYVDTLLDTIDMLNGSPYGAIPEIKKFYPIERK